MNEKKQQCLFKEINNTEEEKKMFERGKKTAFTALHMREKHKNCVLYAVYSVIKLICSCFELTESMPLNFLMVSANNSIKMNFRRVFNENIELNCASSSKLCGKNFNRKLIVERDI